MEIEGRVRGERVTGGGQEGGGGVQGGGESCRLKRKKYPVPAVD